MKEEKKSSAECIQDTPPGPKPRWFISAVSPEFETLRKKVDQVIRFLDWEAVVMDTWGTERGDVREALRRKINSCDGLIQIVGEGYGSEPEILDEKTGLFIPVEDEKFGRVSYTQFEFFHAQDVEKETVLLFAGSNSRRNTRVNLLDLPTDNHNDPDSYQAERRGLQATYRRRLRGSGHFEYDFVDETSLENLVLKLRDDSVELREQFRAWQIQLAEEQSKIGKRQEQESRTSAHRHFVTILLIAALIMTSIFTGVWLAKRQDISATTVKSEVQQSAEDLSAQLQDLNVQEGVVRKRAERDFKAERKRIEDDSDLPGKREALSTLEKDHKSRLDDIGRLFEVLRTGYRQGEINDVTDEFRRILDAPPPGGGIDAALAFLELEEDELISTAKRRLARAEEERRQARAALRSLLVAAGSAASEERFEEARRLYKRVVDTDPTWSEGLIAAGWFYNNRSKFEERHGSLMEAIELALEGETMLEQWEAQNTELSFEAKRVSNLLLNRLGDLYSKRSKPGDRVKAISYYENGLKISRELVEEVPESRDAQRNLMITLNNVGDYYVKQKTKIESNQALDSYREAWKIAKRLSKKEPEDGEAKRDISVSLNKIGDYYFYRGSEQRLDQALAFYEDALEINRLLHEEKPENYELARDLSLCLNRVGICLSERGGKGDIARSFECFEEALNIVKGLRERFSSNELARDLSVILDRLGDGYSARGESGDSAAALKSYLDSLQLRRDLLDSNPESGEASRDVAISLVKMGNSYAAQGGEEQSESALLSFKNALEIYRRLQKSNPKNGEAARDVAIALDSLGDYFIGRGNSEDFESALRHYEKSYEIRLKLLGASENNETSRDVAISLNKIGDCYSAQAATRDLPAATKKYEEALKIFRKLKEDDPKNGERSRDVSVSLDKIGSSILQRNGANGPDRALANFSESLTIRQALFKANPENARAARDILVSKNNLGDYYSTRLWDGDAQRAKESYEDARHTALVLQEANPESAYYIRDVAVTHLKLWRLGLKTGDLDLVAKHIEGFYFILEGASKLGIQFDYQIATIYADLRSILGDDWEGLAIESPPRN